MKSITLIILSLLMCFSFAGVLEAHHAMEYIEMESYTTAMRGEFLFHLHYDYYVDDEDNPDLDHWEFTPGLTYGITDRLMFDIHTHFASFGIDHIVEEKRAKFEPMGPSPFMEAMAISVQYRFSEKWPIHVGLLGMIEIPFSRAEKLLGSEDNVYEIGAIISKDFWQHANITANFSYANEGDDDEGIWKVGAKTPISSDPHGIAVGIEAFGEFSGDSWMILPGIYAPLGDQGIILKTGIGFGGEELEDGTTMDAIRANISFLYRF